MFKFDLLFLMSFIECYLPKALIRRENVCVRDILSTPLYLGMRYVIQYNTEFGPSIYNTADIKRNIFEKQS